MCASRAISLRHRAAAFAMRADRWHLASALLGHCEEMGGSMTNLEIALSVAEIITLAALVRIYRKHMIVRHLFIDYSDGCARQIDEMTGSASCEIIELAKASAEDRGRAITDDEAQDWIPDVILDAKEEWQDRVDYLQANLKHNGMAPLGVFDLDTLVLNPGLAGFKKVPRPQRRPKWAPSP